jgi:hypothetical protein
LAKELGGKPLRWSTTVDGLRNGAATHTGISRSLARAAKHPQRGGNLSYRDDLGAAHERAAAAERKAALLQKRLEELEAAKRDKRARRATSDVRRVPIPERFDVELQHDTLRVRWRWFRPKEHMFLLFFVLVWDGALAAMFVTTYLGGKFEWGMLLAAAHVAVGVGLTYSLLAGLFNRTTVSASAGRLTIKHAPIPWRGNRELTRSQLRQLYVVENVTESDGSKTRKYDLCAVRDDDRQVKLVKGLEDLAQARYLEHAFELHLDIDNHPVADEATKT